MWLVRDFFGIDCSLYVDNVGVVHGRLVDGVLRVRSLYNRLYRERVWGGFRMLEKYQLQPGDCEAVAGVLRDVFGEVCGGRPYIAGFNSMLGMIDGRRVCEVCWSGALPRQSSIQLAEYWGIRSNMGVGGVGYCDPETIISSVREFPAMQPVWERIIRDLLFAHRLDIIDARRGEGPCVEVHPVIDPYRCVQRVLERRFPGVDLRDPDNPVRECLHGPMVAICNYKNRGHGERTARRWELCSFIRQHIGVITHGRVVDIRGKLSRVCENEHWFDGFLCMLGAVFHALRESVSWNEAGAPLDIVDREGWFPGLRTKDVVRV